MLSGWIALVALLVAAETAPEGSTIPAEVAESIGAPEHTAMGPALAGLVNAPIDIAAPDTAAPDTAAPDTAVPDNALPNSHSPDSAESARIRLAVSVDEQEPVRDEPQHGLEENSADAELRRWLDAMPTLTAGFEQTTENASGYIDEILQGTIQVAVPGRLRWSVDEPFPQLVLADGVSLWVYDPDLLQVSVRPISAVSEAQQSLFIAGTDTFVADHRVTKLDPSTFRLEPRSPDSIFRDLTLRFDANGIASMVISDHLDSLTTIEFFNVVTDVDLGDEVFRFEVPADVDLVGELPATLTP